MNKPNQFRRSMKNGFMLSVSALSLIGCGNNSDKPQVQRAPVQGANATPGNYTCVSDKQCPKLNLTFGGASKLGGSVGQVLSWNIQAKSLEDPTRSVVVVLHEQKDMKQGMQIRSANGDPALLINWKPESASNGFIEFRARDVKRCMMLTNNNQSLCYNFSTYQEPYDIISNYPFEVMPSGESFDVNNSAFFKSFACDTTKLQKSTDKSWENKAVEFIAGTVDHYIGTDKTLTESISQTVQDKGGISKNVAVITDFIANGEDKPTAYDCYKQQSAGSN